MLASFRTQVNHPISTFHDVQVMFDNDDGMTVPSQTQEDFDELVDIREGKAGGWFV